mmetsp:Transcript_88777/g.140299  ORF Transcript_88777/g.140299 Transcript_88777/m.140299 type:complete len:222 (-) Transcript_88777:263-928(-)
MPGPNMVPAVLPAKSIVKDVSKIDIAEVGFDPWNKYCSLDGLPNFGCSHLSYSFGAAFFVFGSTKSLALSPSRALHRSLTFIRRFAYFSQRTGCSDRKAETTSYLSGNGLPLSRSLVAFFLKVPSNNCCIHLSSSCDTGTISCALCPFFESCFQYGGACFTGLPSFSALPICAMKTLRPPGRYRNTSCCSRPVTDCVSSLLTRKTESMLLPLHTMRSHSPM